MSLSKAEMSQGSAPDRCPEYNFIWIQVLGGLWHFEKWTNLPFMPLFSHPSPTELLHLSKIWDLDHTPPCPTVTPIPLENKLCNHEVMRGIWTAGSLLWSLSPPASPCSSQCCTQLLSWQNTLKAKVPFLRNTPQNYQLRPTAVNSSAFYSMCY